MKTHRSTCISRLAELADDSALTAAVVWALAQDCTTEHLSLAVQAVLELRDAIADDDRMQQVKDELERRARLG